MLFNNVMWIFAFTILILNFLIYLSDPLKHSNQVECLGLPCRIYSICSALLIFTIDLIILIVLTHTKPFMEDLPKLWYIGLGIIGYLIIFLIHNTNYIVEDTKKLNPPDEYLFNKNIRSIFYIVVLVLYTIIFLTLYNVDVEKTIPSQPLLEKIFFNRFGGYKYGNKIIFSLSCLIILGIPISAYRVYKGVKYHPNYYKLPLSWKI